MNRVVIQFLLERCANYVSVLGWSHHYDTMSGVKRKLKTLDYFFINKSKPKNLPVASAAHYVMLVITLACFLVNWNSGIFNRISHLMTQGFQKNFAFRRFFFSFLDSVAKFHSTTAVLQQPIVKYLLVNGNIFLGTGNFHKSY